MLLGWRHHVARQADRSEKPAKISRARELERRGYAIVARRYRRRGGELDIIARDGATLVFVEVKARDGRAFGEAAEAVTGAQAPADGAARASTTWCGTISPDCPCRFDVVVDPVRRTARRVIEVFQNAFDASY